ncbi:MAG TPA: HAD-IA family hydrolase [Tepidisphaeraceae bacterium]|jgi:HAD superfamily hydrolase (TIGR01509 family)
MIQRSIRGVIFDLDGTLADTFPVIVDAWNAGVAPIMGREYKPDEVISRFGEPEPIMIRNEVGDRWEEACERYYAHYEKHHASSVQPFEGIETMLREVKRRGLAVGLVTGKSRRSADITLKDLGWSDLFASVITGTDMKKQKPEPDGLIDCAKAMGMNPAACAMVGDSPADIGAGKAAGMMTIVAAWHSVYLEKLKGMQPDAWAHTPADVVTLINK